MKTFTILTILLLGISFSYGASDFSNFKEDNKYSTTTTTKKSTTTFKLAGTVVSNNKKMMTSRYMGYVKNMAVSEGDLVKKGQLLYEIDSTEIEAAEKQVELAISQAELMLQMNRNQYNNILINLARHERLYVKKMISKFELETLQLAAKNLNEMVKISEKQKEQAQAKKEEVMNQYEYLRIKSPNDGVIIEKRLNEGEMAIPGMPAVILTDLTDLKVVTELSESQIKYLDLDKDVHLNIKSIGYTTTGKVQSIVPSLNPMTHKFRLNISFKNKVKSIYPGMYVQIIINK